MAEGQLELAFGLPARYLTPTLSAAAQSVFSAVHGYVFVIDASRLAAEAAAGGEGMHTARGRAELQTLLSSQLPRRQLPLLVLACYRGQHSSQRNADLNAPLAAEEDVLMDDAVPPCAPLPCVKVREAQQFCRSQWIDRCNMVPCLFFTRKKKK